MNDTERPDAAGTARLTRKTRPAMNPRRVPTSCLLYSLIALALAVAIGLAALIVWPFYRRA